VRVEDLEEQLHGWQAAIQPPSGFREQFARAIADGQLTKKAPARSIGEEGALVSATPRAGWLPYSKGTHAIFTEILFGRDHACWRR